MEMDASTRAKLACIATRSMSDMLRRGEGMQLPSAMAHFIQSRSWEAVEFVVPETGQTAIASFGSFSEWVTASPARGGLGSRLDVVIRHVVRSLDDIAAPECCLGIAQALSEQDRLALLPALTRAVRANAESGERHWLALLDEWDRLTAQPLGTNQHNQKEPVDSVHKHSRRPSGNSAAAGLRMLRRYSESAEACASRGLNQAMVAEQYRLTLQGQKSVRRALIDAGLKAAPIGALGDPESAARRFLQAFGRDRAAQLVTYLTELLSDDGSRTA